MFLLVVKFITFFRTVILRTVFIQQEVDWTG